MKPDTGAHFAILEGGVVKSYRDDRGIAIQAAEYAKQLSHAAEVSVRDDRDRSLIFVAGKTVMIKPR